jgi:spore maturation protein CgeB
MFYHSLVSDWNHGNAHFLRGVVTELMADGHEVAVYEPSGGWSRANLVREHGEAGLAAFRRAYPRLTSTEYRLGELDLDRVLDGADLVLAHEWSEPELIARLSAHRNASGGYRLLFHDTHHRAATAPAEMARYDLSGFDGVLAFGAAIAQIYKERGWAERVWVWHEAADTRVFRPHPRIKQDGQLVWIGNWGDGERATELEEFLLGPARELGLRGRVHGVRYPEEALASLRRAGLEYGGWLPNARAPEVFARFAATVHVPRRPYVEALPGVPTIRVFEALACGIPLVCAPWHDREGLFTPGRDYLVARNGAEMSECLRGLLDDPAGAAELARRGLQTIRSRHTCRHRVDELMMICRELGMGSAAPARSGEAA